MPTFVGRDSSGSIVPTELAYVSTLKTNQYCVRTGPEKFDTTGLPRYYADVVVADIKGTWLVNQWTSDSEGVVIEDVAQNILMQSNRAGNTNGRRISLPKFALGPLFTALNNKLPGEPGPDLADERVLLGERVLGCVVVRDHLLVHERGPAQLVTSPAKIVDGKPVPDKSSFGLSIKMHNAFYIDTVDYHGLPQQSSTGMMIPARNRAEGQAHEVERDRGYERHLEHLRDHGQRHPHPDEH
ncbi:hypothetical protein F4859DRAFT_518455 [Xylaria cf. heliscus]|nr:hypothetical protein F4859DRAFT_518455 [Xylaria cf. heliscus]